MKNIFIIALIVFGIPTYAADSCFLPIQVALVATCTGAKDCKACKNCKNCKYCAKEGNTCGMCEKKIVPSLAPPVIVPLVPVTKPVIPPKVKPTTPIKKPAVKTKVIIRYCDDCNNTIPEVKWKKGIRLCKECDF